MSEFRIGMTGRRTLVSPTVALALGGCQTFDGFSGRSAESPAVETALALSGVSVEGLRKKADTYERKVTAEAIEALRVNDLRKASQLFNAALKLKVASSDLHALNALTYHLMALAGDSSKFDMAEEGYKVALRFEPYARQVRGPRYQG